MYYAIGVSVPSLHRESTDSLIHVHVAIGMMMYCRSIYTPLKSQVWKGTLL